MSEALKRTPLHEVHVSLGATMGEFAGWHMPIEYPRKVKAEYEAVRGRVIGVGQVKEGEDDAALFDVSHMGRAKIRGRDRLPLTRYITTGKAFSLAVGQSMYTFLLNEKGGIIDDAIFSIADDHIKVVFNAGNRKKDLTHMQEQAAHFDDVEIGDISDQTVLFALQGRRAHQVLYHLGVPQQVLEGLKFMHYVEQEVAGIPVVLFRSGYTGERGYELQAKVEVAEDLWNRLTPQNGPFKVRPAGLAVRDVLSTEVNYPLHGHEIDEDITPFQAGLENFVSLDDDAEFIGRDALLAIKNGEVMLPNLLAGFEVDGGVARPGMPIYYEEENISTVVRGTHSFVLNKNIALAHIPKELSAVGSQFQVDIRGRKVTAQVVDKPFYKRGTVKKAVRF